MSDGTRGGSNDATLPLIATDDAGVAGQVQITKLALSANGSATPITADADGLLVNLGANNDVTVASLPLPSGAATLAGQTQPGVDIGDVTVNNGAGAAAVNIQDGGNVITVDGTVTAAQATAASLNATVVGTGTFAAQVTGTTTGSDAGTTAHDAPGAAVLPLATGGYASAAAPTDVSADADIVRAWNLRNGARATVITAAGALVGGDAANGLDVDVTRLPALVAGSAAIGKLAANSGVDIGDVDVTSIAAGDNNIGNVDIVSVPSPLSTAGHGTAAAALRVELPTDGTGIIATVGAVTAITNAVTVNSHAVTNAGTFATQVDGAALTSLQLIDDSIFADEAAFTVASSKVTTMGLHSVVHGSAPDAAAVDTAVNPIANRDRVPFVIGGHPNVFTYSMSITTAVTDAIIGATNSAGTKPVVTGITVVLDNASTVFPTFIIGFGTANTPAMATTPGTAQILASHPGIPAGGGFSRGDGSGILGVGADGAEIRITTTGTAGGNGIYVTVTGYLVPS